MNMMQWHRRLGHLNKADILRLARDPSSGVSITGVKGLPFARRASKTRRRSKILRARSTRPLERIHIDIAGGGKTLDLVDEDINKEENGWTALRLGAKWVLGITDDATRFCWVYS